MKGTQNYVVGHLLQVSQSGLGKIEQFRGVAPGNVLRFEWWSGAETAGSSIVLSGGRALQERGKRGQPFQDLIELSADLIPLDFDFAPLGLGAHSIVKGEEVGIAVCRHGQPASVGSLVAVAQCKVEQEVKESGGSRLQRAAAGLELAD